MRFNRLLEGKEIENFASFYTSEGIYLKFDVEVKL